jgi:hypothetical protein
MLDEVNLEGAGRRGGVIIGLVDPFLPAFAAGEALTLYVRIDIKNKKTL